MTQDLSWLSKSPQDNSGHFRTPSGHLKTLRSIQELLRPSITSENLFRTTEVISEMLEMFLSRFCRILSILEWS